MPGQVRLVVETGGHRDLGDRHPAEQQPPGAVEPTADDVAVRRQAVLAPEHPHQVRGVGAELARQRLQRRLVVVQPGADRRASPGSRPAGGGSADDRWCGDPLDDQSQPRLGLERLVEAVVQRRDRADELRIRQRRRPDGGCGQPLGSQRSST